MVRAEPGRQLLDKGADADREEERGERVALADALGRLQLDDSARAVG